jgi:hypothetical protein
VSEPSKRELDAAVALIAATHPDADVLTEGVAEAYADDHPDERLIYLGARRREALRAGDHYVTWVVTIRAGQPVDVARVGSRACSTGGD